MQVAKDRGIYRKVKSGSSITTDVIVKRVIENRYIQYKFHVLLQKSVFIPYLIN